MNIVISEYVEGLFINAPQTRDILDIKEELAYNLNEKFEELVRGGMSKEDAFRKVTSGVGNIQELIMEAQSPKSKKFSVGKIDELEKTYSGLEPDLRKSFHGLVYSSIWLLTVILYFFILFPGRAIFHSYAFTCGWVVFLIAAAVQACFTAAISLPTLRDLNFKIKSAESESDYIMLKKRKKKLVNKIGGHISTILWCLTVVFYILFSFAFRLWAYSWLIFIVAAILQNFLAFATNWFLAKIK